MTFAAVPGQAEVVDADLWQRGVLPHLQSRLAQCHSSGLQGPDLLLIGYGCQAVQDCSQSTQSPAIPVA